MFITFGHPTRTNSESKRGQERFFKTTLRLLFTAILNLKVLKYNRATVLLVYTRQDTMHKTLCKTGTLSSQHHNESDQKMSFCRITYLFFLTLAFLVLPVFITFLPTALFFYFTTLALSFPFLSQNAHWN